jgi:hypothetical protein
MISIKLLQQIGEGGMGTVFMAEQTEPVRRMVALKIIKPGMDSSQVIARFEAERQALALMDHPNIAKVFDAGTVGQAVQPDAPSPRLVGQPDLPGGRPYFVMELVKGIPITRFCDENRLTPRERLQLFIPVCQAVQHAHQKGIIHRDLKPSNVLVALYDDRPVPKVIDFGVAKATGDFGVVADCAAEGELDVAVFLGGLFQHSLDLRDGFGAVLPPQGVEVVLAIQALVAPVYNWLILEQVEPIQAAVQEQGQAQAGLALNIPVRVFLEHRAQKCFAFFAKAELDTLASLAELVAADEVAQQDGDGPGLPAVLSPAWVRAIVVQPVFKGDDMREGIQCPRFIGVILGQFQEL